MNLDFDQVQMSSVLSLIYLGIVSTAIAFMIRAKLIFENGLIFMSQVSLLIPIFGLYFSWLFLSEQFSINMFDFFNYYIIWTLGFAIRI